VLELEAVAEREKVLLQKITPTLIDIGKQQAGGEDHATELRWWPKPHRQKSPCLEGRGQG
jgi:hypothetical protein